MEPRHVLLLVQMDNIQIQLISNVMYVVENVWLVILQKVIASLVDFLNMDLDIEAMAAVVDVQLYRNKKKV